jgi:recombination protein RecT
VNAVATIRQPTRLEKFMGDMLPNDQRDSFYAVLPRHISPDRFERAVANVLMNNPEMMAADPRLIFREISKVVGLGLMLDPQLGEAYLIMGWNGKTRQKEPQVRIGYKGLIKLAKQSGEILNIYAREVHEKDEVECLQGDENRLIHKPKLFTDRGPIVGYYAAVKFRNGEFDFEPMDIPQIHAIRDRSDGWKAYADGKIKSTPWSTDEGEMAKKTVLRRLQKRLSQSPELVEAVSIEDKAEFSEFDRGPPAAPRLPARPRQIASEPPAAPRQIEHTPSEITAQPVSRAPVQDAEVSSVGDPEPVTSASANSDDSVVTMDSLLTELDDRLSYAGSAIDIEEAYTDFDAEALLSDYPGGVEAGRKLKAQHLDRVAPANGQAVQAEPVDDFPGNEALAAMAPVAPTTRNPALASTVDPFAIPEFKGGGHYQIFIRAACDAAKSPEHEERLRLIWAQTKPQRDSLAAEGQLDRVDVKGLIDAMKVAFERIQAAAQSNDEPQADLPPPAPNAASQAAQEPPPAPKASKPAAEPEKPASDDPVATYTERLGRMIDGATTKAGLQKAWLADADVRDETGASESQRLTWKAAMQRRKADLPETEA